MATVYPYVGGTPSKAKFDNNSGEALSGGKVYFYVAGTSTPKDTYSDSAGTVLNANPVILDSRGEANIFLLSDQAYKVVVKDSSDVTIYTVDNVSAMVDIYSLSRTDNATFGDALVGFKQSTRSGVATGSTSRTVHDKLQEIVSVFDFMSSAQIDDVQNRTLAVNVTAAIQAAIDHLESVGGGRLLLPRGSYRIESTLTVDNNNVEIIGDGGDTFHDAGAGSDGATRLAWYGASGGTMLDVKSQSGAGLSRKSGQAVKDIELDCRSIAGIGLLVTSIRKGTFSRIHIENPTIAAVKTTTISSADLAEAPDIQECLFERVTYRCLDSAASKDAHGFWLTSNTPSATTGNTSFNEFRLCGGQSSGLAGDTGIGLLLEDADNNLFFQFRNARANGTDIPHVEIRGYATCDSNHFFDLSAPQTNGIVVKGTASGYPANPTRCSFVYTDNGNGTLYPTLDSGCRVFYMSDLGVIEKLRTTTIVAATSTADANTEHGSLGSETVRIRNGSSNHIVLTDGTNVWGINIDAATGDLRLNRTSGTGAVNVGNGVTVKIGGKAVSEGAVDSGGAGFRVLRVPNA